MSFPPFQPSVQQSFRSNTAFSPNIPPVNQIANDPSSDIRYKLGESNIPASFLCFMNLNNNAHTTVVSYTSMLRLID
jgi:hypothetical protein